MRVRTHACTRLHAGRCRSPGIPDPLFTSYVVVRVVADPRHAAQQPSISERDETQVDEPAFFRVHQRAACLCAGNTPVGASPLQRHTLGTHGCMRGAGATGTSVSVLRAHSMHGIHHFLSEFLSLTGMLLCSPRPYKREVCTRASRSGISTSSDRLK